MEAILRYVKLAAITSALSLGAISTFAQTRSASPSEIYPARPIRFIVPFPASGGADIIARIIGQKLNESWGQPVVIDNRPGSGGMIGAEIAAKSAPDGYTLFLGNSGPNAVNVSLYRKLPYDPVKDFAPVTLVVIGPIVMVVNPSFPAKSVNELIALAKSRPGQFTFAFGGVGSQSHLAGKLFINMAGIDVVDVPYKGGPPALTDLLGGRVTFVFTALPVALPLVEANKLRALAVTGAQRSPAAPDVPTIKEFLPGYEAAGWWGVLVPAGTPKRIINKLNAQIVKILNMPDVKNYYARQGLEPVSTTPEEFAAYIKAEIAKWAVVIKNTGIQQQ